MLAVTAINQNLLYYQCAHESSYVDYLASSKHQSLPHDILSLDDFGLSYLHIIYEVMEIGEGDWRCV